MRGCWCRSEAEAGCDWSGGLAELVFVVVAVRGPWAEVLLVLPPLSALLGEVCRWLLLRKSPFAVVAGRWLGLVGWALLVRGGVDGDGSGGILSRLLFGSGSPGLGPLPSPFRPLTTDRWWDLGSGRDHRR